MLCFEISKLQNEIYLGFNRAQFLEYLFLVLRQCKVLKTLVVCEVGPAIQSIDFFMPQDSQASLARMDRLLVHTASLSAHEPHCQLLRGSKSTHYETFRLTCLNPCRIIRFSNSLKNNKTLERVRWRLLAMHG